MDEPWLGDGDNVALAPRPGLAWPAVARVLEDCPLAAVVLGAADGEFVSVWATSAFGQMTGYDWVELAGSGLDSLAGGADPAGAERLREAVLAGSGAGGKA